MPPPSPCQRLSWFAEGDGEHQSLYLLLKNSKINNVHRQRWRSVFSTEIFQRCAKIVEFLREKNKYAARSRYCCCMNWCVRQHYRYRLMHWCSPCELNYTLHRLTIESKNNDIDDALFYSCRFAFSSVKYDSVIAVQWLQFTHLAQ